MVYETDFYTTRRPYSRPTISSYSVTTHYMKPYLDLNKETWDMNYIKDHQEIVHARREIPWEKVPYVPRPALIADPVTAWGKRQPKHAERRSILEKVSREQILPLPESKLRPLEPYVSTREKNRERILNEVKRQEYIREVGGTRAMATSSDSMDLLLPRLHGTTGVKDHKRHLYFKEPGYAYY